MARLPAHMQATDYASIDGDLSTQQTSDDISNFIPSKVSKDLKTDEEDCEKEDESVTSIRPRPTSTLSDYCTSIQSIRDLTTIVSHSMEIPMLFMFKNHAKAT